METISVNPEKLKSYAKKIDATLVDFDKKFHAMVAVINSNQAAFDKSTLNAILTSCNKMETQYKKMSAYLNNVVTVTKNVAAEFSKVNESAEKKIKDIAM